MNELVPRYRRGILRGKQSRYHVVGTVCLCVHTHSTEGTKVLVHYIHISYMHNIIIMCATKNNYAYMYAYNL